MQRRHQRWNGMEDVPRFNRPINPMSIRVTCHMHFVSLAVVPCGGAEGVVLRAAHDREGYKMEDLDSLPTLAHGSITKRGSSSAQSFSPASSQQKSFFLSMPRKIS